MCAFYLQAYIRAAENEQILKEFVNLCQKNNLNIIVTWNYKEVKLSLF